MRALSIAVVLALVAAACASGGETAGGERCQDLEVVESGVFDLAGRPGTIVHVPGDYDGANPTAVVLAFHGAQSKPEEAEVQFGFSDLADREGFLAVYPMGSKETLPNIRALGWSMARTRVGGDLTPAQQEMRPWLTAGLVEGNQDIDYVDDLLDELGALFCVDSHRVFAAGHSMGGGFAFAVGCTLANRITAVGVASAFMVKAMGECAPARPMPIMGFHSIDDPTNPYQGGTGPGGAELWSFSEFGELWASINGCEADPEPGDRSGTATSKVWSGCSAPVVMWSLPEGLHTYPGDSQSEAIGSNDVDASEMLWEFFAQQELP